MSDERDSGWQLPFNGWLIIGAACALAMPFEWVRGVLGHMNSKPIPPEREAWEAAQVEEARRQMAFWRSFHHVAGLFGLLISYLILLTGVVYVARFMA